MNATFNPDGSIKLPAQLATALRNDETRMRIGRCLLIRKDVTNPRPPKTCRLRILLSEKMHDDTTVERVHASFRSEAAATPTKLLKTTEKEYVIDIGTAFERCKDCTTFIGRLRAAMDENIIVHNGTCDYKPIQRDFSYEDHFD